MIIELNEQEIEAMFREYVEKHYIPRFPGDWISLGRRGNAQRYYLAINKDKAVAENECNKALNRDFW